MDEKEIVIMLLFAKRVVWRILHFLPHLISLIYVTVSGNRNASDEYLRSVKDKYKGQRCFVIGNGPSLTAKDLDKLKGEITFASNRIYKIFNQTEWRPTYFTIFDEDLGKSRDVIEGINSFNCEMKFVREEGQYIFGKINAPICYIRSRSSRKYLDNPKFSENMVDVTYSIATVTYISLQLARHMGFSEIYLLGMDRLYAYSMLRNGKIVKNNNCKDYFSDKDNQSVSNRESMPKTAPATWEVDMAYSFAEKYSREHGFRIYNATRGGTLEVFERVDFDSLFSPEDSENNAPKIDK